MTVAIPMIESIQDQITRYLDFYLKVHAIALQDGVVVEIDPRSKIACAESLARLITETSV